MTIFEWIMVLGGILIGILIIYTIIVAALTIPGERVVIKALLDARPEMRGKLWGISIWRSSLSAEEVERACTEIRTLHAGTELSRALVCYQLRRNYAWWSGDGAALMKAAEAAEEALRIKPVFWLYWGLYSEAKMIMKKAVKARLNPRGILPIAANPVSGQNRDQNIVIKQRILYDAHRKSTVVAYLLWFFLGGIGVHRFYLGRPGSGAGMIVLCILAIITGGLWLILGIWWIIDAFLIPGIVARHNEVLAAQLDLP